MVSDEDRINKIVYVVGSQLVINDRVKKVVALRDFFDKLVLVKAGRDNTKDHIIEVTPLINPIGLFYRLGLHGINRFLNKYVFFPSAKVFYAKAVARVLSKLIKQDLNQDRSVCVLTCLPAHDLVLTGLVLKKRYPQIQWIVDWQDLWSYDENYLSRIPTYYRQRMFKLEHDALHTSDLNLTTNQYAKKVLEERYQVDTERVVSIHHHFSRNDFQGRLSRQCSKKIPDGQNKLKLGFLGVLFKPPRVPGKKVLEAVEYVRKGGTDLELHLFGDARENIEKNADGMLPEGVIAHGRFPHHESLAKVSECDFLLLVLSDLPNSKAVMSIKLPHYLLIGKPIIAIVPDKSAVADIIRETNSGYIIPASSEHWGNELDNTLTAFVTGQPQLHRNIDAINSFSWENLSREWLKALSA